MGENLNLLMGSRYSVPAGVRCNHRHDQPGYLSRSLHRGQYFAPQRVTRLPGGSQRAYQHGHSHRRDGHFGQHCASVAADLLRRTVCERVRCVGSQSVASVPVLTALVPSTQYWVRVHAFQLNDPATKIKEKKNEKEVRDKKSGK